MVVYIFVHIKWFRNILLQLSCISTYHVTVSRINILTCFDPWQVPQTIWPLPEHCTHLKYNSIDILLLCVERIKWAQDVTPTLYKKKLWRKRKGYRCSNFNFLPKVFWPLFFFYFVLFLVDIKFVFFDLGQRSHKSYD